MIKEYFLILILTIVHTNYSFAKHKSCSALFSKLMGRNVPLSDYLDKIYYLEDPAVFQNTITELEQSLSNWIHRGDRTRALYLMNQDYWEQFVRNSLEAFDDEKILIESLRPIFVQVQGSYHVSFRNHEIMNSLDRILRKETIQVENTLKEFTQHLEVDHSELENLFSHPHLNSFMLALESKLQQLDKRLATHSSRKIVQLKESLLQFQKTIDALTGEHLPEFKMAIRNMTQKYHISIRDINNLTLTTDEQKMREALIRYRFLLKNENIILMTRLGSEFENYATIIKELEEHSLSSTPEMRLRSIKTLKELQSHKLLATFSHMTGEQSQILTPTLEQIQELLEQSPLAQIRVLKRRRNAEMLLTLTTQLTPDQLTRFADHFISKFVRYTLPKFPKIANAMKNAPFRLWLSGLEDLRLVLKHYANIEIFLGQMPIQKKLQNLMLMDTGLRDDSFLLTFARRTDVEMQWHKLLNYARIQSEQLDPLAPHQADMMYNFYQKLLRIESRANEMSNLPPWRPPTSVYLSSIIINGVGAISISALTAYLGLETLYNFYDDSTEESSPELQDIEDQAMQEAAQAVLPLNTL